MGWQHFPFVFVLVLSLLLTATAQDILPAEFGIKEVLEIDILIKDNGFVEVTEKLVLDQTTGRILIPKESLDLQLTDSQGNDLGYELNQYIDSQTLNIYLKSPLDKEVTLSYTTATLTTKNASLWTFKFSSLSTNQVTIITVTFPLRANITAPLRSQDIFFIYPPTLSSPLFIYPQSERISLEIDYYLPTNYLPKTESIHLIILASFFLIIIVSFVYLKKRSTKTAKVSEDVKEETDDRKRVNPSVLKMLDEAEKDVVMMLEDSPEEEITQAYIYKTLGIPKSSLSDTIRRLEQRDLIEKKKEGRINWIKLKEWVFD